MTDRMKRYLGLSLVALVGAIGISGSASATAVPSIPTGPGLVHKVSDGGDCGWFAIAASSRNRSGVAKAASWLSTRIVDSDNIPEFTPNLYVALIGPDSRGPTEDRAAWMRENGYADAYVKFGCEY